MKAVSNMTTEQRELEIVRLGRSGVPAVWIAKRVSMDVETVCMVLEGAGVSVSSPCHTFQITDLQWSNDGKEVEGLPSRLTLTFADCYGLDEEEMKEAVLDAISERIGWCVRDAAMCQVPGAAFPTSKADAAGLLEWAASMGELRMGDGRYALVTPSTLEIRYPKHFAFIHRVMGGDYFEQVASEWRFVVIDTQDTEGHQFLTDDLFDLVILAHQQAREGNRRCADALWDILTAMGLQYVKPLDPEGRVVRLDSIVWKGKWKKVRHLPVTGEITMLEYDGKRSDAPLLYQNAIYAFAELHGAEIKSCVPTEAVLSSRDFGRM